MTSNLQIPTISKENDMSEVIGLKSMIGQSQTKKVNFVTIKVTIRKLTVNEVLEIQELVKPPKEGEEASEQEAFNTMRTVIRMSCLEAEDMEDEDFNALPLDDLSKLSQEIMNYSGIGAGK